MQHRLLTLHIPGPAMIERQPALTHVLRTLAVIAVELLVLRLDRPQAFFRFGERHLRLGAIRLELFTLVTAATALLLRLLHPNMQSLDLRLGVGSLRLRIEPGRLQPRKFLIDAGDLALADRDFLVQPLPAIAMPLDASAQVAHLFCKHIDLLLLLARLLLGGLRSV